MQSFSSTSSPSLDGYASGMAEFVARGWSKLVTP